MKFNSPRGWIAPGKAAKQALGPCNRRDPRGTFDSVMIDGAASMRAAVVEQAALHGFVLAIVQRKIFLDRLATLSVARSLLDDTRWFAANFSIAAVHFFHLDALADTVAISATGRGELFAADSRNGSAECAHSSNSNEVRIVTGMPRHENEFPGHRSHRATFPANPLCSWVLMIMIGPIRR